ncbi:30S ribosome-binding factor RbfA [Catenibacterium sp.]|uniref:30S ribosome-binding factor RbfA n=1 Tax=Catenibacterium sp. TaxID=2049022 RepID=UPI002E79802D|nr:30S ribosome-binding factor RbfA [Catenibacterium sp.]MEE0492109.1 30S ribosome-binding factor RbfA [Catenibacterium sp.]
MASLKVDKMNHYIMKELSLILRDEVKDPALRMCTVTSVSCTNDMSVAKVYVTFMKNQGKGLRALERCKGFIRSQLARRLKIRKCPELIFKVDESLEYGNRIEELIKNLH